MPPVDMAARAFGSKNLSTELGYSPLALQLEIQAFLCNQAAHVVALLFPERVASNKKHFVCKDGKLRRPK